ncbi:hypothetical protein Bhyg_06051, partial [Pseudolycoriella hygida]
MGIAETSSMHTVKFYYLSKKNWILDKHFLELKVNNEKNERFIYQWDDVINGSRFINKTSRNFQAFDETYL